ncbi:MBL fold metallo-hydrolase [Endozoicomonas sp.]|uniref:MBL fold metallo-hydrolase n=1 Tax=Endozoicomonas sp. TaxID=1892382 RepID=UPI003AF9F77F
MAKIKSLIGYAATALVFTGVGVMLSDTELGDQVRSSAQVAKKSALSTVADQFSGDIRERVLIENPELIQRVMVGGGFGGNFSKNIGQHIFGKNYEPAIQDALEMTEVKQAGDRMWIIHMPIVNSILLETDEGLVVIDTGMAPAGPALIKAIRSVSDKPIHTIIITHGHTDHAYGTYALVEDSPNAQIIAHENIIPRFERYIKLRGSLANYMSQPVDELPAKKDDIVWPTRTFKDRLELTIGGEAFVLQHHRGETDDHLYVWIPGRKAIAVGDFYQGFLPNVGNGKRRQRYVEDWAVAMREMAALKPEVLLPSHGVGITTGKEIQENFVVLAEALESITEQTLDGLNQGVRKDLIVDGIELPEELANHPTLQVKYVSAKDISKMLLKQYTGWWSDIPSDWSPAPWASRGAEIAGLAGGVDQLVVRAREVMKTDLALASHMADWAWMADSDHPEVQQLTIDVYKARVSDPATNTQEMLTYIDQMARARQKQLEAGR